MAISKKDNEIYFDGCASLLYSLFGICGEDDEDNEEDFDFCDRDDTYEDPEIKAKIDAALDAIGEIVETINKKAEEKRRKEDDLKKCPICGSTCHTKKDLNGMWSISCGYCPLETSPIFDTEEEAIEYWNDRV